MIKKELVFTATLKALENKINMLSETFTDLQQALTNDTKSSAGDKHETSRAMTQLEMEKLGTQLHELNNHLQTLLPLKLTDKKPTIINGSLVHTNNGYFYVAIPLGKIQADNTTLMVISPQSPLGAALLNKTNGDSFTVNAFAYTILDYN